MNNVIQSKCTKLIISKSSYTIQNVGNFNPEGVTFRKSIVGRCNSAEPTCSDL
jgi:hypothetical protein